MLSFDIILFRKDPPVNLEYIYSTYLLEQIANKGVLVANNPKSIRDCNEKLFATQFPEFSPPTLVTSNMSLIKEFQKEHQEIIVKPLDSMGGNSIFKLIPNDSNINVILEASTLNGSKTIMAQKFNVTCPTCIQEIDSLYDLNIAKSFLEELERML